MKQSSDIKKELLFKELWHCFDKLRNYADLNFLLMPLLYILCAHHEGHLVSIVGDGANPFIGDKHVQPLLDADMNDAESDLLKRIRRSVDARYFRGKTVQIIYDFYLRNNQLITEFYPELIEYVFTMYSKSAGKYSGMFATPSEITQLMYTLATQGNVHTIYDPCAGLCSGVLLPEMDGKRFVGQEINEQIKLFADIRLDAHRKHVDLYCEDTSRSWRGEQADCLCSDFPIGIKIDDRQSLAPRKISLEEYIIRNFIETPSLKRAVVLTATGFCFNKDVESLRQELIEKGFVESVIELPTGVLSYTGVNTAILVLNKLKEDRNIQFISAADCFFKGKKEKTLDVNALLDRILYRSDEQKYIASVKDCAKRSYSLIASTYISSYIALQAGQKLVKFLDLAKEIRNTRYTETEGLVLGERQMCASIAEFHTFENRIKSKSLEGHSYNMLTKPCVIFNLRADKFFIKTDCEPLFVSVNYRAFEVDTTKCLQEYLALVVLKSKDIVKSAIRGAGAHRVDYKSLYIPIYEDLETQQQIIEREYRQETQLLRKKLERLQTLSGQSSDLLHNLGVTFTRLDAAVANLQRRQYREMNARLAEMPNELDDPMSSTIEVLDDNIKYALRLINSTGTDFSKATPSFKKVVLEEVIRDYIESWKHFGYATFSILPLKSDIPQTKVEIDVDMLYTALDCILINAHQHGFHKIGMDTNHVLIELKAVTISDKKFALVSISNNGEPLPDGFTLSDFAARGVVGLNSSQDGLGGHHVASIAHLHGGHVAIEQSTEWLSFHVLIPTYINAKDTVFDEYGCEYL